MQPPSKNNVLHQLLFENLTVLKNLKLEIVASTALHVLVVVILVAANFMDSSKPPPKKIQSVNIVAAPPLKGELARKKSSNTRKEKTSSKTTKSTKSKPKKKNIPKPETNKVSQIPKKEKPKEKEPKPKEIEKEPEKKEPEKKEPEKKEPSREELVKQMLEQANENSDQSSKTGTAEENRSPDGSNAPADGPRGFGKVDPVLVKYIQDCRAAIMPNWTPLPTLVAANPNLEVTLKVRVEADGTMKQPQVYRTSGNRSFDQTALMSIYKTKKLPAPPEKLRQSAAAGVTVTLSAHDKI